MDTNGKIACCKICLLAENMKDCKACQFKVGLSELNPQPVKRELLPSWFIEAMAQAADFADLKATEANARF